MTLVRPYITCYVTLHFVHYNTKDDFSVLTTRIRKSRVVNVHKLSLRGIADGGGCGGQDTRTFENRGGRPPAILTFQYLLQLYVYNFTNVYLQFLHFPTFVKKKWPKSEDILNVGGRWF